MFAETLSLTQTLSDRPMSNTHPIIPDNELKRLEKLVDLDLLFSKNTPELNVFTEASVLIADCNIVFISTMTKNEQVMHSTIGIPLDSISRKDTICQYVIESKQFLMIPDILQDERSSDKKMMAAAGIRFYLGIPLIEKDGLVLGTLCILDHQPKTLTSERLKSLTSIAQAITKLLVSEKTNVQADYFEQIFSITNNLMVIIDREFRIKESNQAFKHSLNYTHNQANTLSFFKIVGEHDDMETILQQIPDKEQLSFTSVTKINGEVVTIEWLIKQNESNLDFFCFGRKLTEELQRNVKLENSERKYKNFFENAIGLMSVHDLQGNILAVNKKGRELLEYKEEEIEGLNLRDLIPERNHNPLEEYLQRVVDKKEDLGNMVLLTKSGTEVFWMYHNLLLSDEQGETYVVSTALNITN